MRTRSLGFVAALVSCLSFASAANASSVIFSDFGSGNTSNGSYGYTVDPGFSPAMLFTSSNAAAVSQIDLGLSYNTGINGATVTLLADNAGALGASLGSWSVSSFPQWPSSGNTVTTISGISGVNLAAGGSYFLQVTQPDSLSDEVWNGNSTGATGTVFTGGVYGTDSLSAFDVLGSSVAATPLPSTWLMLLSGFVGLGFLAYRGTKKNAAALAAA